MMRGEEDYKERWGAIPTWNYRVVDLRDRFIEKIKFMLYKRIRH
jgi:predicted FMN-binding regulatory protein PaiB